MTDLSFAALEALLACLVKRGPNKGCLLAKVPSAFMQPLAYAAWQGAQMSANPHKVSIGGLIFLEADARAIAAPARGRCGPSPR